MARIPVSHLTVSETRELTSWRVISETRPWLIPLGTLPGMSRCPFLGRGPHLVSAVPQVGSFPGQRLAPGFGSPQLPVTGGVSLMGPKDLNANPASVTDQQRQQDLFQLCPQFPLT